MEEVVALWNAAASPIRSEIESISFIGRSKAGPQPTNLRDLPRSATLPIGISPRRTSSG